MTPNEQTRRQHQAEGSLGFNDDEGVYCGLIGCDWRHMCKTLEEMESRLKAHVRDVHGLTILCRTHDATGKLTRIP